MVLVVELAGVQAAMQLAEKFVEQVSLWLVLPVFGGAAGIEVAAGPWGGAQRCQGPDPADTVEASVLDMAMHYYGFLASGTGARHGSGERPQTAGVDDTGTVVSDLCEHPGTGRHPQGGETGEQATDLVGDLLAGSDPVLLGAHDVGQRRIGAIGFGNRERVLGPVRRCRQWVHRVDHPSGFARRPNRGTQGPSCHKPSVISAHRRASFCRRAQSSGTTIGKSPLRRARATESHRISGRPATWRAVLS